MGINNSNDISCESIQQIHSQKYHACMLFKELRNFKFWILSIFFFIFINKGAYGSKVSNDISSEGINQISSPQIHAYSWWVFLPKLLKELLLLFNHLRSTVSSIATCRSIRSYKTADLSYSCGLWRLGLWYWIRYNIYAFKIKGDWMNVVFNVTVLDLILVWKYKASTCVYCILCIIWSKGNWMWLKWTQLCAELFIHKNNCEPTFEATLLLYQGMGCHMDW